MAERSVTVRISATDNFSTVVDRYNQKMGTAETKTRDMGGASDDTKGKLGFLKDAVGGIVSGIALQQVINFGSEMANLGTQVNLTKQRFDELVSPMGDVEGIIQRLRDASMGTASDQTLMEGSNLLMMSGIASSPEELEQIIDLVTKTKKPTEDLNTAINNFSLMLMNNSLLRLDSFGLSSSRVRARILELLESGEALDRSQAFKMAVLEDGAKLIDRLGASAEGASTPLARLQTDVENLKNSFASDFATGVQGTLGILEILLGQNPQQQAAMQEAANLFAADFQMAMQAAVSETTLAGADQNFVSDFMTRAIKAAQADPQLGQDAIALRNAVLGEFGVFDPEAAMGPGGGLEDMAGQINALAQIASYTVSNNALARDTLTLQSQQADEAARVADATERVNQLYADAGTFLQNGVNLWTQMSDRAREAVGLHDQMMGGLGFIGEQAGGIEMGRFMSQEDADTLARLAREAQATVDQMKELDEVNNQLFTDEELSYAQGMADSIGDMADEADRAANALANIKLSDIFGTTGGGVAGEVGDQVIAAMRANGATDEQIEAFQREMDLLSGRETTGSLALKENLIPEIAALTDDPETMAEMAKAISDVLIKAAQMGIDPNNPEFINELGTELQGEGEGFDPDTFLTNFQELDGHASTFKDSINTFLTDITAAQTPVDVVETSMGQISTFADNVAARFKELTAKVQVVRVKIETEISGDGGQFIEGVVRNNGGYVPGMVRD